MTPRYRRVLPTLGLLLLLATPGYADNDYRRWVTFLNPFPSAVPSMAWPVVLTPANFDYAHTDPSGANLYFTDAGGTSLPHYVETWTPGGTSVVWVKAPNLPANAPTSIAMYYGDFPLSPSSFGLTFPNAYVLASGTATLSGSLTYDWFEIGPAATVLVTGSELDVVARRILVRGTVNANGKVAPGNLFYSDGQGDGAGRYANGLCSGAGHGGTGGTPNAFIVPPGGVTYGASGYSGEGGIEAGSSGANSGDFGGAGGGKVRMIARRMDFTGAIAANGLQGPASADAGSGGGSGGGILLKAFDLVATGSLSAQGSQGGSGTGFIAYGGGGGGGGRIKVAYEQSVSGTPTMTVTGGAGGDGSTPGRAGAHGSTFFGDSNEPAIAHPSIGNEEALKPTGVPTTSWGRVKALYRR